MDGWDYTKNMWRFKKVEVCRDCHTHFRKMRNNALCEAEENVNREFLREIRETVYQKMR
jgi:hypothetical protein